MCIVAANPHPPACNTLAFSHMYTNAHTLHLELREEGYAVGHAPLETIVAQVERLEPGERAQPRGHRPREGIALELEAPHAAPARIRGARRQASGEGVPAEVEELEGAQLAQPIGEPSCSMPKQ